MKEQIYTLFQRQSNLTWQEITANIIAAALIGFVIFVSYYITHRGTIYSKKFNASLVVLTTLTGTVMTVIGNNIALSLGMVGALSIVRFRTAIKDTRDTIYIFWTIIVGICCGVGDYLVACIGSGIVFVVFLFLGCIKNDNRILLIIRATRNKENAIHATVFKLFGNKTTMRVQNTTETTVELIYELTEKTLDKAKRNKKSVSDMFYELGGIEYVNLVMQNDEISN